MRQKAINVAEPLLDGNETKYVLDCMQSSWISSRGAYIERFESMVASYCEVPYAVAANNGTTALHLALVSLGIGPGDEVIVPTLTYIASVNAIHYCGAKPVFVDSEPEYLSIDPNAIKAAITKKTKAILTVPLYGHPVDMNPITAIAEEHDLAVVEDSAEALGALYDGRRVGSLAKCSTFSFFGNKLITTGEGGMIVTADRELADRMRFLRGQGVSSNRRYWHPEIGFNYRMTNVAAAIGCGQMERIDHHLGLRQQVAEWYFDCLRPYEDLFQLPYAASWASHSYWMYTILLRPGMNLERDRMMELLQAREIETRPVFYPVHWMPSYADDKSTFPIADRCSASGINLPTHGKLTKADVKRVSEAVVEIAMEMVHGSQFVRKAA